MEEFEIGDFLTFFLQISIPPELNFVHGASSLISDRSSSGASVRLHGLAAI
jgi:hypothetical protein